MPLGRDGKWGPGNRDLCPKSHPLFSVAKAPAASSTLDAAHIVAAIFLPLVAMALLAGGVYLYFSR